MCTIYIFIIYLANLQLLHKRTSKRSTKCTHFFAISNFHTYSSPILRQICSSNIIGGDGEYAAAGIALSNDGKIAVIPQEYGTYSLKDGWYMEMGRPALKDGVVLSDKTHYRGRWKNRSDLWVKHPSMPDKVVRYIVECCKMKDTPSDIQQLIKQNMFK